MESKGDKAKFRLYSKYPIYGASRLGINKLGGDSYELTDHIGNVRVVVEDDNTAGGNLIGRTDYYSFGMPMPNRNVEGDYRYAYQGQEKDPENGKEAFELRLWDSRIGRWLTPNPAGKGDSPYTGMYNNPLKYIDLKGADTLNIYVDNQFKYSLDDGRTEITEYRFTQTQWDFGRQFTTFSFLGQEKAVTNFEKEFLDELSVSELIGLKLNADQAVTLQYIYIW